jgi:uncharacterized protein (TIGR04222 family)
MINPFDLMGGPFLAFYLVVGLVTVIVYHLVTLRSESSGPAQSLTLQDPYAIAYLRAGAGEAIGVAVASLLDRGLIGPADPDVTIFSQGTTLRATSAGRRRRGQPLLERAIIVRLERPATLRDLMTDSTLIAGCKSLEEELARRGLVVDLAGWRRRAMLGLLVGLPFIATGLGRIVTSLSRGHTNLLFLVAMMIIGIGVIAYLGSRRRTGSGRRALTNLWWMFRPLYHRREALRAGDNPDELAFLAAVFGLAALPSASSAVAAMLPPKPADTASTWMGHGSDTAGSSSDGGSSCGGGGSGCGGCGS